MPEVVHKGEDGKWYFWNEVWSDALGPYDTEDLAKEACNRYVKEVLDPQSERMKELNSRPDLKDLPIEEIARLSDPSVPLPVEGTKDFPKGDPLGLRFFRTPEDLAKGLPKEVVEDLKKSALEAFPGLKTLVQDPEPVPEPWSKLSDAEVDQAMAKCGFHEIKKTADWCKYLHNYCMVGNQASLPKERGYIADVCLRGY